MNIATLSIIIDAVDRGARVAIKGIGDEAKKLGTDGSAAVAGMRTKLGELDQSGKVTMGTFTNLAAVTFAGAVAGFAALSAGMVAAIGHASTLNETTNKFNTVFAGMTGQAETWATELQSSYGMSKNSSMDMLASLQVLTQGMGMSQGEAGKLSDEMIKLAVDLGSFNNLPTVDVLNAMRSALVGEYDPIQKFAGAINAAAVEQKALAMNLATTKDALTAADKAQAMYQLVLESNGAAIGDFIKTSDGLANQTKIFQANIEDLSGAFGTRLLPVAADVLKKINAGMTEGKGGVDGLSETISVKLLQALGMAVETMRFFHNGWLGIKLVGTLAIDALAQSVDKLYTKVQQTIHPINTMFEGLYELDLIKVNPFANIEQPLGTFASSSRDVTGQVMADIASTNAGYDTIKTTINGYIDMVKTTGPATATAAATAVAANTAVAASSQKVLDAQSKLHDKLAKDMAKNAEEQVRLVVWADGVTRNTITSQYDRKLTLLNMEYEAAKKTAAGNITSLQEVETWHKASIARIQSYDEQYSKADQKRLEGMKDTFMVAEEQKVEASNQTFVASQKAYESMTAFVTSSKQTEVEIWREASDKQIAELEKLSDGTQEYTDALNAYKETKDREYYAKLKKQTKENLTEMDKLWQTFGHDVHNNFTDVVSAGLHGEFNSIGDAWKSLTDSMLDSFIDLIAKMIVAWAEAEIFGTSIGISIGGSSGGGSIVGWIADAIMGTQSTATQGGQYQGWEAGAASNAGNNYGMGSGSGSGSGGAVGGTVGSLATSYIANKIYANTLKPAVDAAWNSVAQSMEQTYNAASNYLSETFSTASEVGAQGIEAASEVTAQGIEAAGEVVAQGVEAAGEVAGQGIVTAGETVAPSVATQGGQYVGWEAGAAAGEGGAGAAGAGAGSYAVLAYMAYAAFRAFTKVGASTPTRLNREGLGPQGLVEETGLSGAGRMEPITEAFRLLDTGLQHFSAASLDTSNNMLVLGSEIREVGEQGTTTTVGMDYLVTTFNTATSTWEKTKIDFGAMVEQMNELAPTTADAIDATASYVAEMNGVVMLADELAIAYAEAALGADAFGQSIALIGGAFENASGVVMSGVDMVNAAAAGMDTSGFYSADSLAEGHNFANNPDAISTPATDASYYELNGRAEGGIVDRLLIPNGDDGIAALSLGEGVIDKDTMKILSTAIRRGELGGGSSVVTELRALRQELAEIGSRLILNAKQSLKTIKDFQVNGVIIQ